MILVELSIRRYIIHDYKVPIDNLVLYRNESINIRGSKNAQYITHFTTEYTCM